MNQETLNKIVRKKVLWAEIDEKEMQYRRVQNQIDVLEMDKHAIKQGIKKKLKELEEIAEWLLRKEYESLNVNP